MTLGTALLYSMMLYGTLLYASFWCYKKMNSKENIKAFRYLNEDDADDDTYLYVDTDGVLCEGHTHLI